MIRLSICISLVLISTIIGYRYSNKLAKRKKILQNFLSLLDSVYTKITYSSSSLAEIFNDSFLEYEFDDTVSFSNQWEKMLLGYKNILSDEDIKLLSDFSKELGNTDVDGQINNIRLYQGLLNESIENAKEDIEKKSRLYTTLGFSIGMTLSIILI